MNVAVKFYATFVDEFVPIHGNLRDDLREFCRDARILNYSSLFVYANTPYREIQEIAADISHERDHPLFKKLLMLRYEEELETEMSPENFLDTYFNVANGYDVLVDLLLILIGNHQKVTSHYHLVKILDGCGLLGYFQYYTTYFCILSKNVLDLYQFSEGLSLDLKLIALKLQNVSRDDTDITDMLALRKKPNAKLPEYFRRIWEEIKKRPNLRYVEGSDFYVINRGELSMFEDPTLENFDSHEYNCSYLYVNGASMKLIGIHFVDSYIAIDAPVLNKMYIRLRDNQSFPIVILNSQILTADMATQIVESRYRYYIFTFE